MGEAESDKTQPTLHPESKLISETIHSAGQTAISFSQTGLTGRSTSARYGIMLRSNILIISSGSFQSLVGKFQLQLLKTQHLLKEDSVLF